MKRLILVMTACLAVAVGRAADYGFLTFLSADGTKVSMNVTALTMTFVDGKLVASNGTETHEMSVADLNSMYFTDQNLTGIAETTAAGEDNVKQVYTLAGVCLGTDTDLSAFCRQDKAGIYVVKTPSRTFKMTVK